MKIRLPRSPKIKILKLRIPKFPKVTAHTTLRYTKAGLRITNRSSLGSTTITHTSGAGKKPRTTISTRSGNVTSTRTY